MKLLRGMCLRGEMRTRLLLLVVFNAFSAWMVASGVWFTGVTAFKLTLIWGPWCTASCTLTAPVTLIAQERSSITDEGISWQVNAPVLVHTKKGNTWNATAHRYEYGIAYNHPETGLEDIYHWWVSELGLKAAVSKIAPDASCPCRQSTGSSWWCYEFGTPRDDARATVPCM